MALQLCDNESVKMRLFRTFMSAVLVLAVGASADLAWRKNFGGSGNDYYHSATAVSDGIVVVGSSTAASFGNGDWQNGVSVFNHKIFINNQ